VRLKGKWLFLSGDLNNYYATGQRTYAIDCKLIRTDTCCPHFCRQACNQPFWRGEFDSGRHRRSRRGYQYCIPLPSRIEGLREPQKFPQWALGGDQALANFTHFGRHFTGSGGGSRAAETLKLYLVLVWGVRTNHPSPPGYGRLAEIFCNAPGIHCLFYRKKTKEKQYVLMEFRVTQ